MSEIEKLYENAGIKGFCKNFFKDLMPETCLKECEEEDYKCKDCEYYDYPEFTAEKQLNLLLFQINKGIKLEFKNESKTEKIQIEALTDSIAGLLNHIWQDLSKEEKAEIKRILE